MKINQVSLPNDATKHLTDGYTMCNAPLMARSSDVLLKAVSALAVDAARQRELTEDMHKLADAYHRYIALEKQRRVHELSARDLMALIGPEGFKAAMKLGQTDAIGWQIEISPTPKELREQAPLWELMRTYLLLVPEAQANDILDFFHWYGISTTRQAIESALRTHTKVFKTTKRGREKFISLK